VVAPNGVHLNVSWVWRWSCRGTISTPLQLPLVIRVISLVVSLQAFESCRVC
jgi:hypothetical protein